MFNTLKMDSVIDAIHPNRVSAMMPQKIRLVDDSQSLIREDDWFINSCVPRLSPAWRLFNDKRKAWDDGSLNI